MRKGPRGEDGSIAVEFALLAPLLLMLITVLVDLAMAGVLSNQLSNGARAGAQYSLSNSQDVSGIEAAVRSAGIDEDALNSPSFAVNVRRFCECVGQGEVACPDFCASGDPSRMFVEVTVHAPYSPLFPYPLMSGEIELTGSAVLQVR